MRYNGPARQAWQLLHQGRIRRTSCKLYFNLNINSELWFNSR